MTSHDQMRLKVAVNFEFLLDNFSFEKSEAQDKQGFVHEGGSGSAKSYDIIQFLMYYCQMNEGKNKDILVFRQTYADLKKTILKDFVKILKMYELYDVKNHKKSHPQSYELFGNIWYFTGLDGVGSHGERHDIIWGNEGMELNFDDFRQLNQRCNEAFFIDYNPSFTDHWIFDNIISRKDTKFFRSTQLDNPFLPKGQRQEILAYEPWESGSYYIEDDTLMYNGTPITDTNQPPSNRLNIDSGTADEFMWKVYGLGLRGAMRGQIYKHVAYIDEFPRHLAFTYGLDFGFTTDPTALVKYAKEGRNVYLELLLYAPTETSEELHQALVALGISEYVPITADSADRYVSERKGVVQMVRELFDRGWEISKVSKTKGVTYWILDMKGYKIHIVMNDLVHHFKKEQQNYRWKEINGIQINQPIDGHDHAFSSGRYAHMSHDRTNIETDWN